MKKIYLFTSKLMAALLLAASPLVLGGCGTTGEDVVSQTPIIPNLQVITLTQPADNNSPATSTAGTNFTYSADGDVRHMILFVCSGTGCASGMISNGRVNISSVNLIGGNSTSKTMTLTSTVMTEIYTVSNGAFTNTKYTNPAPGPYQWFIIGYDSGGNLIAASPAFTVNVTAW